MLRTIALLEHDIKINFLSTSKIKQFEFYYWKTIVPIFVIYKFTIYSIEQSMK